MATNRSSPFHLPTPLAFASSLELQTWHTTLVRTLSALIDVTGLNSTDADGRLGDLEAMNGVPDAVTIAAGLKPGYSSLIKFGRCPATTGGAWDLVWPDGGSKTRPTTAQRVRIRAGGNAADDAAGTGARAVLVSGLNGNYEETSEVLATAGASASDWSTNTYIRMNRGFVTSVGSGGENAGAIYIEEEGGSATQVHIQAGEGQSQQLSYTVPAAKYAFILGGQFSVVDQEGAGTIQHLAHIRGRVRAYDTNSHNNYQSWRTAFDVGLDTDGSGVSSFAQQTTAPLPPRADIMVEAYTHAANAEVDARLYIVLVDQSIVEGT